MNWMILALAVIVMIELSELKALLKRIAEALENIEANQP
jgi:hypothetical protein